MISLGGARRHIILTSAHLTHTSVRLVDRYPDILSREVEVFKKHAANASTRTDLKRAFGDMALGRLPRNDVVLSALFDNMLPPTDTLAC